MFVRNFREASVHSFLRCPLYNPANTPSQPTPADKERVPPGCLSPGASLRVAKRPCENGSPLTQGLAPMLAPAKQKSCSSVDIPDTSAGFGGRLSSGENSSAGISKVAGDKEKAPVEQLPAQELSGDPGRTLTYGLLFRRQPLYTTELRSQNVVLIFRRGILFGVRLQVNCTRRDSEHL